MAESVLYQAGMDDHDDVWDDSLMIQQYDEAMEMVKRKVANRIENKDRETNNLQNGADSSTLEEKFSGATNKRKRNKSKKKAGQWQEGDFCRCPYEDDGKLYEAVIMEVAEGGAVITFLGYEETQTVYLTSLKRTLGPKSRKKQIKRAAMYDEEEESCMESNYDTQNEEGDWGPQGEEDHSNMSSEQQTNYPNHHQTDPQDRETFLPQPPMYHSMNSSQYPSLYHPHAPPMQYPHLQAPPTHYPQGSSNHPMPDFLPPPPPPPGLPVDNPLLHTMLMSWYMTGYHTGYYKGANSNKKDNKKR